MSAPLSGSKKIFDFFFLSLSRVLVAEGAGAWARQEGLTLCPPDDLITGDFSLHSLSHTLFFSHSLIFR